MKHWFLSLALLFTSSVSNAMQESLLLVQSPDLRPGISLNGQWQVYENRGRSIEWKLDVQILMLYSQKNGNIISGFLEFTRIKQRIKML